jgi:hypothetical protein
MQSKTASKKGSKTETPDININDLITKTEEQNNIIRNQQATINELVKHLKRSGSYTKKSGMVETTKNGRIISISGKPKNSKKKTQYDYLMSALKKIGHAATTDQIAKGLKKENQKFRSMATRKPKSFMQFIYSAVSHLSNKGLLNKHSVNEKAYEYSLPEWNTPHKKAS